MKKGPVFYIAPAAQDGRSLSFCASLKGFPNIRDEISTKDTN